MPRYFRRVRVSRGWPSLPDPVYEVPILPRHKGESVARYLDRIAVSLSLSPIILRERWLDKGSAIL